MILFICRLIHTEAGSENSNIKVGSKLLHLGGEHARSCNNVARQADADHLQICLEDEHCNVGKGGMG